jgi:SNF family Na+-dependent transporter
MKEAKHVGWSTRWGMILAMAGSATGLGNFLRFPVQASQNGGGAFIVPYLVSLVILGIPLMWMEWAMGRYGGAFSRGSLPSVFHLLWPSRVAKYLGGIGILLTFVVSVYYLYIESWSLAYSFFALTGRFEQITEHTQMASFLKGFQGLEKNEFFQGGSWAYFFLLVTLAINLWILSRGISKGIERCAKIAMPLLFLMGVVLVVRVFSLGSPVRPDWNLSGALGFLWNPDFKALDNPGVWLAAAGQVFFTLSLGWGQILTYATYLHKNDDIALSGLTTVSLNEVCEVILGASIGIIAACLFFGPTVTVDIANGGSFDLGFVSMPAIFTQIPAGRLFAFMWFLLLFFAGITSSIALIQPSVHFLSSAFDMDSTRASSIVGVAILLCVQPVYFFLSKGYLDELDFIAGTMGIVFFGLIEVILFVWVFGTNRAWQEITRDNDIVIPSFFKPILTWVTPFLLLVLFLAWCVEKAPEFLFFEGIPEDQIVARLAARGFVLMMFVVVCVLIKLKKERLTQPAVLGVSE